MKNQDLELCEEFGKNDHIRKGNTVHEKTAYDAEKKTVTVTLRALRTSKFSSLDRTCNRHFMEWQKVNYRKIGYKHAEIIDCERSPIDETVYFYTLVYRLKF